MLYDDILISIILAVLAVRALWQSQCGARWESRAASRGELTGTTSMSLLGEHDFDYDYDYDGDNINFVIR